MDATQRKLVRGLKGLIIEIECGKLDRMTEPEYKLFLEGLSLIIEAKKTDYGHCSNRIKRNNSRHYWRWFTSLFPSKDKADGSGHRRSEP